MGHRPRRRGLGRVVGRVWRTARHEDDLGSSDARIVEGLRRGTPAAFAGLHERYAAGIYNLALRVVRHAPDAEDITQDVLIRAFERLPRDREVLPASLALPADAQPVLRLPPRLGEAAAGGGARARGRVAARPLRAVRAAGTARSVHRRSDPSAARRAPAQGRARALAHRGGRVPRGHAGIGGGAAREGAQGLPRELRGALRRRRPAAPALRRRPRHGADAALAGRAGRAGGRAAGGAGCRTCPSSPRR